METGTRVQNIAGIAFKKDFSQQLRLMNSRKPLPSPDDPDYCILCFHAEEATFWIDRKFKHIVL